MANRFSFSSGSSGSHSSSFFSGSSGSSGASASSPAFKGAWPSSAHSASNSGQAIKLTQTVQKGGCAAKVPALELRKILSQVRFPEPDQNLLVDGKTFDDAAIYKVSEDLALVQTLDFFTPIVDSPLMFGKIAAANALSDVYAMGGIPKTAMAILNFPLSQMPMDVATEILQGACDVLSEAKVNFVGGHTIDDETLKFGLSVTGYVHPDRVWTNAKAQEGDVLILTKALGTGTVTAGLKKQEFTENEIFEVLKSMSTLNDIGEILSDEAKMAIRSATDITGFGLLGHGLQMAKASEKTLCFDFEELPVFDKAWEALKKAYLTKAHRTNSQYTESFSRIEIENTPTRLILFDPQTSGGLLLSVDPTKADNVLSSLQKRFPRAKKVGRVQAQEEKLLIVSSK